MKRLTFLVILSLIFITVVTSYPVIAQPSWEQMVYSEKEYKGDPIELSGMVLFGDYSDSINIVIVATGTTNGIIYDSEPVSVWISDRDTDFKVQKGDLVKIFGSFKYAFKADEPILGAKRIPIIDGSSIIPVN